MVVAMAAVFHGFGRSFERSEGNRKKERKTVIEELKVYCEVWENLESERKRVREGEQREVREQRARD